MSVAKRGEWVQVYKQILKAGQRAPQVPEDTQAVPLEMWVKGFLDQDDGRIGEEVLIRTVTGRKVSGKLTEILPDYVHNFGKPQPELLKVGLELRTILRGGGENG